MAAAAKRTDEAMDRKLRPIYDSIDSKNYKQALKLTNAALQVRALPKRACRPAPR